MILLLIYCVLLVLGTSRIICTHSFFDFRVLLNVFGNQITKSNYGAVFGAGVRTNFWGITQLRVAKYSRLCNDGMAVPTLVQKLNHEKFLLEK